MNTTAYNQRYLSKKNYWDFKPSSMVYKTLELSPPVRPEMKLLDIGCGEGANAIFFAKVGFNVTCFDLSTVGVTKTKENAEKNGVDIKVFQADINEVKLQETYDIIFSSGTLQYLLPEKRQLFISHIQEITNTNGLHNLHTFVRKPFVNIAPDAEAHEVLWNSGELLLLYKNWRTESFVEEIKPCNSSGVAHEHVHNRIWTRKTV